MIAACRQVQNRLNTFGFANLLIVLPLPMMSHAGQSVSLQHLSRWTLHQARNGRFPQPTCSRDSKVLSQSIYQARSSWMQTTYGHCLLHQRRRLPHSVGKHLLLPAREYQSLSFHLQNLVNHSYRGLNRELLTSKECRQKTRPTRYTYMI
jgi:hypothetical protein